MLDSIRGRLLLWYTVVLTVLIVVYAATVTYAYWRSLVASADVGLGATASVINQSLQPDISGTFDLNFPTQFRETAFGSAAGGTYYIVWNAGGDLVDRSEPAPSPGVVRTAAAATRDGARELVTAGPAGAVILVGRPLDAERAAVRSLGLRIAGAGAIGLVLSLAGGWFLAGRALAPVARIGRTAGAMVAGDLHARIPVADTDSELEQLAGALNQAFDRLQAALERQRQFTADASHEFRTPLTVMKAEFEWALRRDRSASEYRATIVKAEQAIQRLTDLANRLLTLARGDRAPSCGAVDLSAVAAEAVDLLRPLASERDVTLATDLQPAWVSGDRALIADAVSNLVTNAIQYNRPGGRVFISVMREGGTACARVQDTGVGIPQHDLPRIFDRFYRTDQSRARNGGGAGLGLAIVKEIVEAHGGSVACTSTEGAGANFTVRLPGVQQV